MVVDIPVHNTNVGRLQGKKAWMQNLSLATIAASKVESILGPNGSYKMIYYARGPERVIKVTKDAVEVLGELEIQYPAVKTLAESARVHRRDIGDGVTTFVIVLASLLKQAETLVDKKTHPNVIVRGYLEAAKEASRVFERASLPDRMTEDEALTMVECGRDIFTPRLREEIKESVARAASQGGVDLRRVRMVTKRGGSISDSKLIRGVMLRKERLDPGMPKELHDVKVAVVNKPLDIKPLELKMKGTGAFPIKLEITSEDQMQRFKREEARLDGTLIAPAVEAGAGLLICRSKINPGVGRHMAKTGMMAVEMIDQQDMDAVTEATGATAVGDATSIEPRDLGRASRVWVEKIDEIEHVFIESEKGSTFLLRGSAPEETAELERVVKNAVVVLGGLRKDSRAMWGGGAMYMRAATKLRDYANEFSG